MLTARIANLFFSSCKLAKAVELYRWGVDQRPCSTHLLSQFLEKLGHACQLYTQLIEGLESYLQTAVIDQFQPRLEGKLTVSRGWFSNRIRGELRNEKNINNSAHTSFSNKVA